MERFYLYEYNGDERVINKTLGTPVALDLILTPDVDFRNMELIISGQAMERFNYFEYRDRKRFYFVDRVESLAPDLWKFYLRIDILMTVGVDILPSLQMRYYRAPKDGDNYAGALDNCVDVDIALYKSDKTLVRKQTRIITTIGGDKSS